MKKNKKIVWIGVAALLLCIAFAACGGDDDESQEQPVEEVKTEFAQDETVNYEGVEFSVLKVEKSDGDDFDTPKKGSEYVIVTVKIENKSAEKISYNSFDWKMENSNGQETDTTFTTIDSDTTLSSGDLNPGGTVEGTLAFEEPKGDQGLKLNYYDNSLFDDEATFKIKIN